MRVETIRVTGCDGRQLAVAAAEDRGGVPLMLHAGSPGSRLLDHALADLAADHRLRLLSYDRPGYGLSSPHPDRRVRDAAAEASMIADALGFERFAVWGFSGGGPCALACAALLTERVIAACVFASLGPRGRPGLDFNANRDDDFRDEVELFFTDRAAARRKYRADAAVSLTETARADFWMSLWADRAGTDDAHSRRLADHLAANVQEAARQGDEGWWEDWVTYLSPWGFDLATIRCPVQLWQGEDDLAVPAAHGRWLAAHIPGVEMHLMAGEDHSTIEVGHRREAMSWLQERCDRL